VWRGLLLLCCLVLPGCAGAAQPSGLRLVAQAETSPGQNPTLLRVTGQDVADQPLLPQPGNIWAGVLPPTDDPPLAPTIRGRDRTGNEHAAAVAGAEQSAPTTTAKSEPRPTRDRRLAGTGNGVTPSLGGLDPGDQPTVQLAAVTDAKQAEAVWRRVREDAPQLTEGHNPEILSAEVNGRQVWRLRAGGFENVAAARAFCRDIRAAKTDCWVVPASMIH